MTMSYLVFTQHVKYRVQIMQQHSEYGQ